MARRISYQQAITEALAQEMERDPTVVIMGEDIAGGMGAPGEDDAWGGVLGVTKGLYAKFPGRVIDTPISESAYVGAAATDQATILLNELKKMVKRHPDIDLSVQKIGVFGKLRALDAPLAHCDRVEIYRPLLVDPKEARRQRYRAHLARYPQKR